MNPHSILTVLIRQPDGCVAEVDAGGWGQVIAVAPRRAM
jgi:hypothetical protein